ncbi:hypothetical protein [Pseudomonas putida]|uniref:hypothetical protein n=1 Tax=Pseudomonas putida TaxID=303 RepID=UPI00059AC38E|nr:hypothetical protein [Pseudomonas putida]
MNDPLKHSKANLRAAQQAVEAMVNASSFDNYENEWREYLGHLEKAWVKVERACVPIQAKFQPWQGKFQSLRRKDMLLRYLKAARDADTHSIQDLTRLNPGYRTMNFANPQGGFIERLEIGAGGQIVEYRGDPMIITDIPPQPVALPVKNNGQWYNPPTSHLGKQVVDQHPTNLAKMGLHFYTEFIADVEQTFFQPKQ